MNFSNRFIALFLMATLWVGLGARVVMTDFRWLQSPSLDAPGLTQSSLADQPDPALDLDPLHASACNQHPDAGSDQNHAHCVKCLICLSMTLAPRMGLGLFAETTHEVPHVPAFQWSQVFLSGLLRPPKHTLL